MIENQTVQGFLDALASSQTTPGGGSVAALNGAIGAALVSMVCNVTIGKKNYADVESKAQAILEKSESLRAKLTNMVAEDAAAFDQVMLAFKLPRSSDEEKQTRTQAIQTALKGATLVPLHTAQACAEVIALSETIVEIGNVNAVSDGGAGALTAQAGLKVAALNVLINLGGIKDTTFVEETEATLKQTLAGQDALIQEIYDVVKSKI